MWSNNSGASAISNSATSSRSSMSAAEVSPLLVNRFSNSSSEGGVMKNMMASGRLSRIWRAPWISISRRTSCPAAFAASTGAAGVP
jgi:hypothetical protein